jgi:hypothetical protein
MQRGNRKLASATSRGASPPACVICRRALADDGRVMNINGLSVHVGCAAYLRRRRAR